MILDANDISAEWLTDQLTGNGHLTQGTVVSVAYESFKSHASVAVALTLTYSADAAPQPPTRLVCKLYHGDQFWDGWGENRFYTTLAPQMGPFTNPKLFAAAANIEQSHSYLLMEDVRVTHTISTGAQLTLPQYERCVDELVQLHAHWWEHPILNERLFNVPLGGPLRAVQALGPKVIAKNKRAFQQQMPQLLAGFDNLDQAQRDFCTHVADHWFDQFAARVADGKQITMIHGDFHHYGNICLPRDGAERIRILDWETWKRSLGVYDLAYMLIYQDVHQVWSQPLLERYHRGLMAHGIDYSWQQCLEDYRLALMGCIFPALAWQHHGALTAALRACGEYQL